jgi:predicted phosphodiesterase
MLLSFLILSAPVGLYAEKILCISDYQGGGKSETLERLLETIFTNEEAIDIIIVAGDYIMADDLLTTIWVKLLDRPNATYPEILFARGNHDDAAAMVLDFSYPTQTSNARTNPIHLPDQKPGQVAAYQRDGLLFIVTDPFLSFKRKGYTKRQLDQLEVLLSSSKYTHAFVVGHMPAFPKFRHIGKSLDHFTFARDRLVEILARHDAHFIHGHDHYANMLRIKASLHIGCGMIDGAYGSAVVIDIRNGKVSIRFYEVETGVPQAKTQLAYQYVREEDPEAKSDLLKIWPSDRPYRPDHLWGSNRTPPSRPHYIEMGLMESNLEYFLDWINYFL